MHEPDIRTDPDWIRERDERLEREIREQEHFVDCEIREHELRESGHHYEATTKHSRIRAQLSYENPYDPPEEGEELHYVVTDEDQQLSEHIQGSHQYHHTQGFYIFPIKVNYFVRWENGWGGC